MYHVNLQFILYRCTVVPLQDEDTGELIIADDVNILALLLFCFITSKVLVNVYV